MTEAFDALHAGVQHHIANTLRWDGLRPTQADAVAPILSGKDALVIAPTAGGKTEAAMFPLLSMMEKNDWEGTSVLYICPLRALLNNLQPRLDVYCQWLGRRSAVWHGDVGQPTRQRILFERPDVLMTTPESLEAMLVSTKVDPRVFFSGLQAVVVDEVHAFAGDDRGWHLLAVLERLTKISGRGLQRVGLSATVGNPDDLLNWLQGGATGRNGTVLRSEAASVTHKAEIEVDFVGNLSNAATVITKLHRGEKRLVFVDSRRRAEELTKALRDRGVTTYLSHSSLSASERRQSEEAFSEGRDTVIVATSTLELGVDVGDLDRVIQIGAPSTVASFLQRLGRTGRRSSTVRNCLFLCIEDDEVLQALGLLECWARDWVEPIEPPPSPRHIAAQQLMALCLQQGRIGMRPWTEWWASLPIFDDETPQIMDYLCQQGYLERDGELVHIGPEAERRFGRRYFSDLTAVFSAPPEFLVLAGRNEVGSVGTEVLIGKVDGERLLLLAGRSWRVTHIDWKRRRCFVDEVGTGGQAKWTSLRRGLSFEVTRGMRETLLGTDASGVKQTHRAKQVISNLRMENENFVDRGGMVISLPSDGTGRWWTWAGVRANRTLQASLTTIVDPRQNLDGQSLRLLPGLARDDVQDAISTAQLTRPEVNRAALGGLKFSAALPHALAMETLGDRLGDTMSAAMVLAEPWCLLH